MLNRIIRFLNIRKFKSLFKEFGDNSYIDKPLRIQGSSNITIKNNVRINQRAWLGSEPLTGMETSELTIGSGCVIGDYNHIWATHCIVLENDVLTANHVYISDNLHSYEDINVPIIHQKILQKKDVIIGEGSWLGENVCVIGASVGKHCVIGANSVVTRDIPDYSVAVGAPAKVIKHYDIILKKWVKV